MTDKEKLNRVIAEIKRLQQKVINGATSGQYSSETIREKNQLLVSLISFIDSLQEESVSKDFEMALAEMVAKAQTSVVEPWVVAAQWKDYLVELAKSEEPVSEDLETAARKYSNNLDNIRGSIGEMVRNAYKAGAKWKKTKDESITEDLGEYINELSKQFPEVSFAKLSRIAVRVAKWQKKQLWKPADGDDLPGIDREVIALTQPYPNDEHLRVVFAHRPTKYTKVWNSDLGEVQVIETERHDKGGWNIPDVKWWLDVELSKGTEL